MKDEFLMTLMKVLTFWNTFGGYLTQAFNSWTLRKSEVTLNNFESSLMILIQSNLTQKLKPEIFKT